MTAPIVSCSVSEDSSEATRRFLAGLGSNGEAEEDEDDEEDDDDDEEDEGDAAREDDAEEEEAAAER